ncbi:MarR family transcriptional regulator [Candidatus Woesearchaeota archaeon]|nr:MarR family transcriptional regulator [Candidatus Woesearchaeota archaeon]
MTATRNIGIALIATSIALMLFLAAIKINSDEQAAYLCDAFHQNQLDMSECPAHKKSNTWFIIPSFALAFAILLSGAYMAFMAKETMTEEAPHLAQSTARKPANPNLEGEEKQVYTLIAESNGSMYQSDLAKETGYSKVKTTRILDKLESKGLIERRRRGMTNIVVLK